MTKKNSFKFSCPHCGQHLDADRDMIGITVDCPACGQSLTVQANPIMIKVVKRRERFIDRCKNWLKATSIGVVVLLLFFGLTTKLGQPTRPEETVDDVKRHFIAKLNKEMSNSSCPVWERIENAHITVKVYRANVLECDVATIDGSDEVGADRSNILRVTVKVRFYWDGLVQQAGTTDVAFDLTADGKCTRSQIVRTDARWNTEDPEFWWDVGWCIGALLAL